MEVEEAKVAAAEAAAAVVDEEDTEVGPTLPGQALLNKAKAQMGGFLLPGEGDRWVLVLLTDSDFGQVVQDGPTFGQVVQDGALMADTAAPMRPGLLCHGLTNTFDPAGISAGCVHGVLCGVHMCTLSGGMRVKAHTAT